MNTKKTTNKEFILSEEIGNILYEFTHTHDGDKQCFNIERTDGYETLEQYGLTNNEEVIELRRIIQDIVDNYTELCDQFGDIMD